MARATEVLVVDDESVVCERLSDYLEKHGLVVESFTDSQQALDRLQDKTFDVIVTDLKMNGPTGMDILVAVKSRTPRSEVIIITGYGSFETMRGAEAVGVSAYICKPFKMADMYTLIKKAAKKARRHAS